MKNNFLFMIQMIASVVYDNRQVTLPENVDWKLIYTIASRHNIANLIAYAIEKNKFEIDKEIKALFVKKMHERVLVSEKQSVEINSILNLFEESGISYMPLKGVMLREMYPSFDMRFMADADVLIKIEDFKKANDIMLQSGYEFMGESDHEYNYIKKPFVHIELHKYLIPSYNEDLYSYFGDGWKLAKKVSNESSRFKLGVEDDFVYIFAHFAKHYRDAGVGIKQVLDLWLYLKHHNNIDMDYVENILRQLSIFDFYVHTSKMMKAWFDGGEFDFVTSKMTEFIINSGSFGTSQNSITAKAIRDYQNKDIKKAQKYRYVRMVFPDLKHMRALFPILEKAPVLMPVMWMWRLIRGALFKRKNIDKHIKQADGIDSNEMNSYINHMESVGLDIYNGRK